MPASHVIGKAVDGKISQLLQLIVYESAGPIRVKRNRGGLVLVNRLLITN